MQRPNYVCTGCNESVGTGLIHPCPSKVWFLPSRWAENLTAREAKAEPVRLGDHAGRGGGVPDEPAEPTTGQEPLK